jgi:hypothetical protein
MRTTHILPVKGFRGWFREVEVFTRFDGFGPGFQHHHAGGGSVGEAGEAGRVCKVVLLGVVARLSGTSIPCPSAPMKKSAGVTRPECSRQNLA